MSVSSAMSSHGTVMHRVRAGRQVGPGPDVGDGEHARRRPNGRGRAAPGARAGCRTWRRPARPGRALPATRRTASAVTPGVSTSSDDARPRRRWRRAPPARPAATSPCRTSRPRSPPAMTSPSWAVRPHLGRGRAEHDHDRAAAAIADRGDGPFHQQAALVADQRLRSAVPASSAGGQHQTCDAQLGTPFPITSARQLPRVTESPAKRPSRGSRGAVASGHAARPLLLLRRPLCRRPAGWPRTCPQCGETTWSNPLPVAVVLLPVAYDDGRTGLVVVRRDIEPFRGEIALPGGFIETGESWREAAVRELREETGLAAEAGRSTAFRRAQLVQRVLAARLRRAAAAAGRVAAAVGPDRGVDWSGSCSPSRPGSASPPTPRRWPTTSPSSRLMPASPA